MTAPEEKARQAAAEKWLAQFSHLLSKPEGAMSQQEVDYLALMMGGCEPEASRQLRLVRFLVDALRHISPERERPDERLLEALEGLMNSELFQNADPDHTEDFKEVKAKAEAAIRKAKEIKAEPGPVNEIGARRPINRPCSACGDGDTAMEYHLHYPPFAAEIEDN